MADLAPDAYLSALHAKTSRRGRTAFLDFRRCARSPASGPAPRCPTRSSRRSGTRCWRTPSACTCWRSRRCVPRIDDVLDGIDGTGPQAGDWPGPGTPGRGAWLPAVSDYLTAADDLALIPAGLLVELVELNPGRAIERAHWSEDATGRGRRRTSRRCFPMGVRRPPVGRRAGGGRRARRPGAHPGDRRGAAGPAVVPPLPDQSEPVVRRVRARRRSSARGVALGDDPDRPGKLRPSAGHRHAARSPPRSPSSTPEPQRCSLRSPTTGRAPGTSCCAPHASAPDRVARASTQGCGCRAREPAHGPGRDQQHRLPGRSS